jgi:hypothetical protein
MEYSWSLVQVAQEEEVVEVEELVFVREEV